MENWRDEYDGVGSFIEGRAWVALGGKEGHVNRAGEVTTPIIYDSVGIFIGGLAWVRLGNKEGHINLAGEVTWNE